MSRRAWTHTHPVHGATNEWETPPALLRVLGPFDDDPAGPDSLAGFLRPWRGRVWLNPPYGPGIGEWLAKLADHGNGIALTFARTETRWFFETVWSRAAAVFFFRGRLRFYRAGRPSAYSCGSPSCLIAYGENNVDQIRGSRLPGALVRVEGAVQHPRPMGSAKWAE